MGKGHSSLNDRVGRGNWGSRLVVRGLLGDGDVGASVAVASVGVGVVPVGVDGVPSVADAGNVSEEGQSNAIMMAWDKGRKRKSVRHKTRTVCE